MSSADLRYPRQTLLADYGRAAAGVLRPLDRMQPYRLEMGTKLNNRRGSNLYQFWGSTITDLLNQQNTQAPQ